MDFTDSFTVRPSKHFAITIYHISHHFITNCPQNVSEKNSQHRSIYGDDNTKVCGLSLYRPTQCLSNNRTDMLTCSAAFLYCALYCK